jgi:hypothetical protein
MDGDDCLTAAALIVRDFPLAGNASLEERCIAVALTAKLLIKHAAKSEPELMKLFSAHVKVVPAGPGKAAR